MDAGSHHYTTSVPPERRTPNPHQYPRLLIPNPANLVRLDDLAADGTKLPFNASKHRAMSYALV